MMTFFFSTTVLEVICPDGNDIAKRARGVPLVTMAVIGDAGRGGTPRLIDASSHHRHDGLPAQGELKKKTVGID
jgi:hypothetical protein